MQISIIIPVYNQHKYVRRCIWSIMSQTYKKIEIIVINDGSTDGSDKIIDELAAMDGRIKVVHQPNEGVAAARNKGINIASGKYITFVDGDDYIAPQYIEHLAKNAIQTNNKIILTGVWYVDENGHKIRKICPVDYAPFTKEEWPMRISAIWAHLYLRELWSENNIEFVPEARGEDIPIALFFLGTCTEISVVPTCEYYYVQHQESAMHQFKGLKTLKLPYQGIEDSIQKALQKGVAGSKEYYCLFVFRVLITCLLLARGAGKQDREYVVNFVKHIVDTYFPNYAENKLITIRKKTIFPLRERIAVVLLSWMLQSNLIELLKYTL